MTWSLLPSPAPTTLARLRSAKHVTIGPARLDQKQIIELTFDATAYFLVAA
ncbi:MAG: hypothetical protein AB1813_20745 [Verrucomicrobiota bacterium]